MANIKSAMRGNEVDLQAAGSTTGNGIAIAIPDSFSRHKVTIIGSSGINAGKVKVESADSPTYAGTWALVGAEQTLVASTILEVNFTGVYKFIRARYSTDVGGGTAQVTYVGS